MSNDWREALRERYVDVLLERLRTSNDSTIFHGAADRIECLLDSGCEDEPESVSRANLPLRCGCGETVASLEAFRAHVAHHESGSVTTVLRVASGTGWTPPSVVVEPEDPDAPR